MLPPAGHWTRTFCGLRSPLPSHTLPRLRNPPFSISFRPTSESNPKMNEEDLLDPTAATASPASTAEAVPPSSPAPVAATPLLRPRREPFEYGLLPIPKLIFLDGTVTLRSLKQKFLEAPLSGRVNAEAFAEALQIPVDQATLVIDTLETVLPEDRTKRDVPAGTADVHDLLLFLYVQTYKKLLPRSSHKDAVATADVWPSTSAFDGYLSALSPLQLVRSNSRRFMPSQADEEAHQLSYLQKHMGNMVTLLSESVDGEGDESLLLTMERFEHLGLLIQSEGSPLSQVAPFFANSDPDMPAAPVPSIQVHEWILQNLAASLESLTEKSSVKENGPQDLDVTMVDACNNSARGQSGSSSGSSSLYTRNLTFIEGVSKTSILKQDNDIKGDSVKVLNSHDSVIYILAPLRYATIYGCSDATIILGAVGKAVRVEHCERVHIIAASQRVCIANCRECIFYLGVNQRPLILGDNHKLQVAPYNTRYTKLVDHMNQAALNPAINRWDEPLVLGIVDPHDSLSHPAGVSDVQAESATALDPDLFTNFLIPSWYGGETQPTIDNPFPLPERYAESLRKQHLVLSDTQRSLREVEIEENRKKELVSALHVHFKDWLYASGNIRQLYCLQGD